MASKECVHHASDILLQLEQEGRGKKRAMDEHFPQIVDFFLLVRCKGGFPVGTWEAGAVPLPSHTFEKSQRVYIREEQEVKEIVNSSEMLQGRLDAGGQTHKSGMLLLKSGSFQKTLNIVKALSFVCQFQTFQHMLLILFLILTVHPETIHGNCGYCNTI